MLEGIYNLGINSLSPFLKALLNKRVKQGKEDATRLQERLGITQIPRPEGKLIWFHGASVGETMLGLSFAEKLRTKDPGLKFLFTAQTLTAAQIIEKRKAAGDIHQYFPFDKREYVKRFLDHWHPDAAIFLEGEIWINMLLGIKVREIPLILLNARMTAKTIRRWLSFERVSQKIFSSFNYIHAASNLSAEAISEFGFAGTIKVGNLKSASPPLAIDEALIKEFTPLLEGRNVWLASSTHSGEDETVLMAHELLGTSGAKPLLILAPRHPARTENIILKAQKHGFKTTRRSFGQLPDKDVDVYLWDTLGELANAYKLAPVSLICGSLVRGIGGHNPVEPAQIGSAILSGAYVHNFADIYEDLENIAGAVIINDPAPQQIALHIAELMFDKSETSKMALRAQNYLKNASNLYDEILNEVYHIIEAQI